MKKVMVTGFEPFDGHTINPSMEIVNALPEQIGGLQLIKRILPVEFEHAAGEAILTAEEFRPDMILCFGLAGGREAITPERVAINVMDARIPDNAGRQPVDEAIDPDGENACFSTLPIKRIAEALAAEGIPAVVSNTAGTFVCNDLMYRMLVYVHDSGRTIPCGFVHVPYCEEMERPEGVFALKLETQIRAAERILEILEMQDE